MIVGFVKIKFSGTSVVLGDSQNPLRVILLPNPSHLEAANPVKINHHFFVPINSKIKLIVSFMNKQKRNYYLCKIWTRLHAVKLVLARCPEEPATTRAAPAS
jgi:hypothetical protein